MSTRAMYTFRNADGSEEYHVYKHSDGYPTGAAEALVAALEHAWPLPRYEADEFAAAFVAANKSYWINTELKALRTLERLNGETSEECKLALANLGRARKYGADGFNGGGVRLCASGSFDDIAPHDLEYHYIIQPKKGGNDLSRGVVQSAQLLVTAYAVSHVGETTYTSRKERNGNVSWFPVSVPVEKQGWKRTKLFTAPLKSGDTVKAKAAAWEAKRAA
jgi:hypothetical protein